MDTAYDLKAPVPTAQTLLQLYEVGVARGWGDEDISAIARVLDSNPDKATTPREGQGQCGFSPSSCAPSLWLPSHE